MCVRMGIDLEIFTTLSKAAEPVTLSELAAVKGADIRIAGECHTTHTHPQPH
jgi:hypothetical protein